jgi:hypothetical protein
LAELLDVHDLTKRAFARDKEIFFKWLQVVRGNKGKKSEIPVKTLENLGKSVKEHYSIYETYLWFEMGKLMWTTRHQTMQEEHIHYLENKIISRLTWQ